MRKRTQKCFKINWTVWVFTDSIIIRSFVKGKLYHFYSLFNINLKNWRNTEAKWGRNRMWLDLQWDTRLGLPAIWIISYDHSIDNVSFILSKVNPIKAPKRPRCKNLCGKAKQMGLLKIITHGFATGYAHRKNARN